MRAVRLLPIVAACFSLVACSLFTPAANNITVFRTVALDATKPDSQSVILDAYERVVLSKQKVPYTIDGNPEGPTSTGVIVNCAEPSPDVFGATAVSQQLSAAAQKSVSGLSASADLASAISQSGAQLNRAQTIQLLRDKMFNACIAYANGALIPYQYYRMLASTGEASVVLSAIDGLVTQVQPSPLILSSPPAPLPNPPAAPESGASQPKASAPAASAASSAASSATAKKTSLRNSRGDSMIETRDIVYFESSAGLTRYSLRPVAATNSASSVSDTAASTPAGAVKTDKTKKTKTTKTAAAETNSASSPASSPAPLGPSVEAILAVQYLTSKYIVSTAVHDCMDYYSILAQTGKGANAGLDAFCQALVESLIQSPPAAGVHPSNAASAPISSSNDGSSGQTVVSSNDSHVVARPVSHGGLSLPPAASAASGELSFTSGSLLGVATASQAPASAARPRAPAKRMAASSPVSSPSSPS